MYRIPRQTQWHWKHSLSQESDCVINSTVDNDSCGVHSNDESDTSDIDDLIGMSSYYAPAPVWG